MFIFTVHLSYFWPIHHDITTSFVHINTQFFMFTATITDLWLTNTKVSIIALFIFKITVVITVLCIAVPYCCSLFYIYQKFFSSIRIITLFQYSLPFHFSDEKTQRWVCTKVRLRKWHIKYHSLNHVIIVNMLTTYISLNRTTV